MSFTDRQALRAGPALERRTNRQFVNLIIMGILALYVFATVMYHAADLVKAMGIDSHSGLASLPMKFRASMDCRPYVAQTGDESCYSQWLG